MVVCSEQCVCVQVCGVNKSKRQILVSAAVPLEIMHALAYFATENPPSVVSYDVYNDLLWLASNKKKTKKTHNRTQRLLTSHAPSRIASSTKLSGAQPRPRRVYVCSPTRVRHFLDREAWDVWMSHDTHLQVAGKKGTGPARKSIDPALGEQDPCV